MPRKTHPVPFTFPAPNPVSSFPLSFSETRAQPRRAEQAARCTGRLAGGDGASVFLYTPPATRWVCERLALSEEGQPSLMGTKASCGAPGGDQSEGGLQSRISSEGAALIIPAGPKGRAVRRNVISGCQEGMQLVGASRDPREGWVPGSADGTWWSNSSPTCLRAGLPGRSTGLGGCHLE